MRTSTREELYLQFALMVLGDSTDNTVPYNCT